MRIRTIKPEFWTDSLMVSLPRDVRLLFIGLWNVADDHGWIPDDPDQIRMLLMPGDHDADVWGWIELLVACDRIERYQSEDGKRSLRVKHWTDHQKVDHPGKSKISREGSRKLAIPLSVRRAVAIKYGCPPGGKVKASCYFCGSPGEVFWFKLCSGKPSSWVIFPDLELDHFVPEASGGEGVVENIVLSCRSCNRSRRDKGAFDFLTSISENFASPREPSRALAPDQGSGIRDQGKDTSAGVVSQPSLPLAVEAPASEPRKRNLVFDATCRADGANPSELTRIQSGRIAKAAADIKRAMPGMSEEQLASEIDARAEKYKAVNPWKKLTAMALAGEWGSLNGESHAAAPLTTAERQRLASIDSDLYSFKRQTAPDPDQIARRTSEIARLESERAALLRGRTP